MPARSLIAEGRTDKRRKQAVYERRKENGCDATSKRERQCEEGNSSDGLKNYLHNLLIYSLPYTNVSNYWWEKKIQIFSVQW